ncbi:MAG: SDR family NAD(P)-dependent oxidoreductase [Dehalococcoidia bacterium]
MTDLLNLQGKTVLVFGGTRKIGRAVGLAYAAAGARVAVTGRDRESGANMVGEIEAAGSEGFFVSCDITDYSSVEAAVNETVQRFGVIDVMVQSAAGRTSEPQGFRPFAQIDPSEIDGYARTHWVSKAYCIKATLAPMIEQNHGKMVIITSDSGRFPTQGESLIGGGAAASLLMVRTLSKEFARWKININGLAISITDTGDRPAGGGTSGYGGDPTFAAKMFEKLAKRQIIHVEGKHVAGAALYLGSELCDATTGQILSVNGGIAV